MTVSLAQVRGEPGSAAARWGSRGVGSVPLRATLGSLSPAAGEQVPGSDPTSGVWGPGESPCLAVGHFLSQADIDQLKRIMEVVGTPSPEVLAKISSEHVSHRSPAPSADQPLPRPHSGGRGAVGIDGAPRGERGSQWNRPQGRR